MMRNTGMDGNHTHTESVSAPVYVHARVHSSNK